MSIDTKIIGGILLSSVVIVIGGVFLLTKQEPQEASVPEDQIISRNGLHWHPRLTIYIKDERQEIPSNVGIDAIHRPIHTHEDAKDGVLHMEMKGVVSKEDTKLGNFFRIWGKEFDSTQIFDKKNGEEAKVKMIVSGKENTAFENYLMKDGDNIEISYE